MVDEARVEKIAKLLAKAERAGTPEEAETFFAKAQELMTKWSVDEAMLRAAGKSSDELTRERMYMKRSGYLKGMQRLASEVAEANGCKILWYGPQFKEGAGVEFVGFASDIEKSKMMYASLLIQCGRERTRSLPPEYRGDANATNTFRKSFLFGYAVRIGERLRDQRRMTEAAEVKADSTGTMALALVDRTEEVDAFFDNVPKSKGRSSRRKYDPAGLSAGRSAANRADLGNARMGSTRSIGR